MWLSIIACFLEGLYLNVAIQTALILFSLYVLNHLMF